MHKNGKMAKSHRVIMVSDLHLSSEYPLFLHNWRSLALLIKQLSPDLVIATGDLALAEPDRMDDLRFAKQELDALGIAFLTLPGNHDIGEGAEINGKGLGGQKAVTHERISQYRKIVGPDHWQKDLGRYRLIGINSQLFGTDLAEEVEQRIFLQNALSDVGDMEPVLIMHKPLYSTEQGSAPVGRCVPEPDSDWLAEQMVKAGGKLVFSGHMHRYKSYTERDLHQVWVPSTAFISTHPSHDSRGGERVVGILVCDLNDDKMSFALHDDHRLITHDIRNWPHPSGNALWKIVTEPSATRAMKRRT